MKVLLVIQERMEVIIICLVLLAHENNCKVSKIGVIINCMLLAHENNCNVSELATGESSKPHATYVSNFTADMKENENTLTDPIPCVPIICGTSYSNKEAHKYMTKLRVTLFQGKDDDESMAP
jgi:hypothetical protein